MSGFRIQRLPAWEAARMPRVRPARSHLCINASKSGKYGIEGQNVTFLKKKCNIKKGDGTRMQKKECGRRV
jgi:hypothetical protein